MMFSPTSSFQDVPGILAGKTPFSKVSEWSSSSGSVQRAEHVSSILVTAHKTVWARAKHTRNAEIGRQLARLLHLPVLGGGGIDTHWYITHLYSAPRCTINQRHTNIQDALGKSSHSFSVVLLYTSYSFLCRQYIGNLPDNCFSVSASLHRNVLDV